MADGNIKLTVDLSNLKKIVELTCEELDCKNHAHTSYTCNRKSLMMGKDGKCKGFERR